MLWDLLKQLSVFTVGAGLLTFLIQSLAKHFFAKDIETFKAGLSRQSIEHEIRFKRLDAKFDEHLVELYRRLYRFFDRVASYVSEFEFAGEPSKNEKLNLVIEASTEFGEYFRDNRIYVPPNMYEATKKLSHNMARITREFRRGHEREQTNQPSSGEDYWGRLVNEFQTEVKPQFDQLTLDVQKRLGVIG